MILELPAALARQITAEARAAIPRECCGLIAGLRDGAVARALSLHPARNRASAANRFEIDPEDHFAALKTARGAGQAVIGCYHSHPGGAAEPSPTDLAGAGEENFLWLIAAPRGAACPLRVFVYRGDTFVGADLVTSSS